MIIPYCVLVNNSSTWSTVSCDPSFSAFFNTSSGKELSNASVYSFQAKLSEYGLRIPLIRGN